MLKKILIIIILLSYFIPVSYSKYQSKYQSEIIINNRVPKYTVKFNKNGGSGSMDDMLFNYGEIKKLNKNLYSNGRFSFYGWKLDNNLFNDEEEVSNLSSIDNDIINLDAYWIDFHVYFQLPPDWGNNIYVYMYNEEENLFNGSWPGEVATLIDSDKKIYSYLVDRDNAFKYNHIIFSDIEYGSTRYQTIDLNFSFNDLGNIFVPSIYDELNKTRIYVVGDNYNLPYISLYKKIDNSIDRFIINEKISGNGFQYVIDNDIYNKFILNSRYRTSGDIDIPLFSDLTYQVVSNNRYIVYRYYYNCNSRNYDDWLNHDYDLWKRYDYLKFIERMNNY